MELSPNVLTFPGPFVPAESFVEVAFHKLEAAFEEEEPNAVGKKLKREREKRVKRL